MKVLCSQEVVSPHRYGVVPCQVTVQASAPPGAVVCPLLVTPVGRLGGYGTVQSIDFYALSCGSFRKQARNLIETAQRKSHPLALQRRLSISRFISMGYSIYMSSVLTVFIALTL